MEATQTTEEKLTAALARAEAAEAKSTQAEQALATERDTRGKAEQELRDANQLVDLLNQQANEQPERKAAPTAKHDGKTYRIVAPQFNLPGHGVVKAEEVKSNSAVLAALVKAGSHVVELVK